MRFRLPLSVLAVSGLVASCTNDGALRPNGNDPTQTPPASFELVDGSTTGKFGFYFLPPLVNQPTITATFNPKLLPEVSVCLLDDANAACAASQPANLPYWGPGEITVQDDKYVVSWDTDDPSWSPLDPDHNYRITVTLSATEMGHLDVNPQNPSGTTPGEDYPGLYAFRLGETLPVKFWLSEDLFCDPTDPAVLQCAEASVLDSTGGTLNLDPFGTGQTGVLLAVTLPPDALPDGYPAVTLTIERLDNNVVQCLPTLDAPQFGPCFRITTEPELPDGLQAGIEALVAICVDISSLGLPEDREDLLQMHRYHTDADGDVVQALPNVQAPECGAAAPSSGMALVPVPKRGLLRYAAMGVNAVARLLGPQPLSATHLGLGSLTSSFSQFRWALPGQMTKVDDNFVVQWGAASHDVTPTVLVVDRGIEVGYLSDNPSYSRGPTPVEGATVHFEGIGDVTTGADGTAMVTWTLPAEAGSYQLTAHALGLWDDATPIPDHDQATGTTTLTTRTVTFSATVVGAPTSMTVSGAPSDGAEVASSWPGISATVADANQVTVGNAHVSWTVTSPDCTTGAESACGTVVDNGDGTVTWTLGQHVGTNTLMGTVDGATEVTSTISVTTVPAPADHVAIDDIADPVVGKAYALSGTSKDGYGNDRPGDVLNWSVDAGSLSGTTWTLGTVAGAANTVTASVDGADPAATGNLTVHPAADVPDVVIAVSGDAQTGPVNQALPNPLVIRVTDRYGNTTSDQSVTWSASAGSSVAASAPYYWTLGPTPNITYTATASVGGSQDAAFTSTAFCRPTLDGTMSQGEWACATPVAFQANISGGSTDAEVYWMNDDENLYLAVRVRQSGLAKANDLRFDFDNDGSGVVAVGDDVIEYDADKLVFFDAYLTSKCVNSSQSGCGAADTVSQDGAGAVGNDGTWTVYELSHPLSGTPGEDFVRSAGQQLGFFLTLRVGSGAQGNTQWPGFRIFQTITIH